MWGLKFTLRNLHKPRKRLITLNFFYVSRFTRKLIKHIEKAFSFEKSCANDNESPFQEEIDKNPSRFEGHTTYLVSPGFFRIETYLNVYLFF